METHIQPDIERSAPSPIRVETATTRYPVHRLAKKGIINISLSTHKKNGEPSLDWTVSHNSTYGQPGPLAYKLDTLVINRRIEEAPRPIPRLIRLGGLRDISGAVRRGKTGNTADIKKALHQNASTYITAKIQYKLAGGGERCLETGFTRYSVIFSGEELPDGRKADAVYIVLSDVYMKVLNGAMTRPLDYEYLKSLPPAPQRFYELLSYQMYAAIKNDRARARLTYSEFCNYAPQTRHFDWLHVRTQMNKLYAPHKASGYITDVDYEQTTDNDGQADWIMLYKPGPKARADYRAFAKRGGPVVLEAEPFNDDPLPQLADPEATPLIAELVKCGIAETIAAELVRDYPEDKIRQQIEIVDFRLAGKNAGKIHNPAGVLVSAIKMPSGHAAPKGFTTEADRQAQADAQRLADQQAAAKRRQEQEQEAREREWRRKVDAYLKQLDQAGRIALETEALAAVSPEFRESYESDIKGSFRDTMMLLMIRQYLAAKPDLLEQIAVDA
jgi:hypothetical protein